MKKTCGQDAFLPSLSITLLLLQLLSSPVPGNGKADFTIFGPGEPVLAMVGEDAELPCWLSLNISIEDMELRWYRDQPSPAVHVHKKGEDTQEEQMEWYRGRTAVVRAGLAQGQAVLRIHNVSAFDNGTFHCHFKDGAVFEDATLWLRVAGLGSEPTIRVRVDPDKGVRAECTSADWYPEPQVEWRDFRGQTLSSVTNLSASPTTGLWAVASSVTIPQDSVMGDLSCHISSLLLSKRKVAKSLLPALFSRRYTSTAWRIALPLTLAAAALTVATIICLFWKRQREKNRKQLEERVCAAKAQDPEASRNGDPPPHETRQEELGWREDGLIYVSPSLDPDTASPKLILSEDGKSVRRLPLEQELPYDSGRFDPDPCVLGQEQLSSGRYYWEVQVGRRKAWTLGVCLESLGRKGRVPKSPQHGIWALELYKKALWALAFPRVRLHPPEPLCRVGIHLDCAAGRVSFHHVADGSLVYVFTGLPFSTPLRPFFCLWTHDPRPLTICSGHQPPETLDLPEGQGQGPSSDGAHILSAPVQPASWDTHPVS